MEKEKWFYEQIGKIAPERRRQFAEKIEQLQRQLNDVTKAKEKLELLASWLGDLERNQPRKKSYGRPSKWQSDLGRELVEGVDAAKANGAKTTADAIRILRKKTPWRGYKQRVLEARYPVAEKYWRPWLASLAAIDAEMKKI